MRISKMIRDLFPTRRLRQGTRGQPRRRSERLAIQPLEERIALAIDVFQYPVAGVNSGSSNYAVLLADDGSTGYLKKNATPAPTFSFATNSQFIDDPNTPALEVFTFGELLAGAGTLSTIYATSGNRMIYAGGPLSAPNPGTTTVIPNIDPGGGPNPIDIGLSDGIVPGTFLANLSLVDSAGNSATATLLASKPGESWNLSILRRSGDGALPTEGRVIESTGDVILRGWANPPQSVDLTPIDWGVYTGAPTDPKPLSFTLFPGQTVTQRFLVDLSRNESTISINSPLLATRGSAGDPRFFSGAGGVVGQVGQVVLDGPTIVTNANVSSVDLFTIGVPLGVNVVSPRIPVDTVAINRPVAAPKHQLIVEGGIGSPGRLLVGEQGSLADSLTSPATGAADSLDVQALHADVIFAGTVNAREQTYLLQSPLDTRAYSLTTVSPTSGVQAGRILGSTVGITLANDAGGEVNVRTTIDTLRMTTASTPSEPALPYAIAVADSDNLTLDAVPASRRPIAFESSGTLTATSSILTSGDLTLSATTALTMVGPVSSAAGNVVLRSNSITASVPITAGGTRGVAMQSRDATGDVVINGLVRAGGGAKEPVKAATTADINLVTGGPLTIDGISIVSGDRVLVKNQANPAENGIYVADATSWVRAADANTAQLLIPGFTVGVRDGLQQGAWTFANPASPTLGQTGLLFVPSTAVQTYVPVRVATTGPVNLSNGGLLQPIDGVTLVAGDRVLVKNQSNKRENGLYIADAAAWVRAADANTTPELVAGSYVFVTDGVTQGQRGFVLTDDAVQVGNTPLDFIPFEVQPTRTNTYSPARIQESVVAATTMHVDLAAPPAAIDGVMLTGGDLVLLKNQFDSAENGIYEYNGSNLGRWIGANSSSQLPRGSIVFVQQGATNANSSWTFNDTTDVLGQLTAGSLQVTGLASTQYLESGMLVTGPGIPADSKIDFVIDKTSIRLTKAPLANSSTAALSFMRTSSVAIGSTPILFVPTGGTATITAGRSITSSTTSASSRITASSAVLTAGRPAIGTADNVSMIDVNSAVGRLSAIAPASVKISDSGAIDLLNVKTLVAGSVSIDAQGTITARSIAAVGTKTTPSDVKISSFYGDVVAAEVNSSIGLIGFTAVNERVVVRPLGRNGASVEAQDGDVVTVADVGGILLEGLVRAGGVDGDITLQSDQAGLTLVSPAAIRATDRLTVITPKAVPTLATGTTVTAAALSITAQFGADAAPSPSFGTYPSVSMNRTDAGNIEYTSLASLLVEGATTVDGSISYSAPELRVTGGVANSGVAKDITLISTSGNLFVDGAVTSQRDVFLQALNGTIGNADGGRSTLITAPRAVNVTASSAVSVLAKATALNASLTGIEATLDVLDEDGLDVPSVQLAGGGTVTLSVGTPSLGGGAGLGLIDTGMTGIVTISSYGDITQKYSDSGPEIVAGSAALTSTNGRIAVDTAVDVITARTLQAAALIAVNDVGTAPTAFTLRDVSGVGTSANITITSPRSIVAENVTTAGQLTLTTTASGASIKVGNVKATGNTAAINAHQSVEKLDPASLITAKNVVLDSTMGTIDAALAASTVAAGSVSGMRIQLTDDDSLSIGNDGLARGINTTGLVDIRVGGSLTQTRAIVAGSFAATSSGGSVSLQNAVNDVDSLTIKNDTRAVAFTDSDDLRIDSVVGGAIDIRTGGPLTQTGAIAGDSLAVSTAAGTVVLTDAANQVNTLTAIGGSDVSFTNKVGFSVASPGVVAGTAASSDGDVSLTSLTGSIALSASVSAANDRVTLEARSGDISQSAGIIDAQTLVWFAKTAPNPALNGTYTVIGPNLTADGDLPIISTTANPLTIAGASTVNGNIIISAPSVRITDTIKTGTAGNKVEATATAGNIVFAVPAKRGIVAAGGPISLTTSFGQIISEEIQQPGVAGGPLTINAQSAQLKTSVESVTAAVTSGGLSLAAVGSLSLGTVQASGQTVTLDAATGMSQLTGTSIKAANLVVANAAGTVALTSPTNDVSTISITNGSGNSSFVDADSVTVVQPGIAAGTLQAGDGDVALTSMAGDITIAADITAPNDRVTLIAKNGSIFQQPNTQIDCGTLVWFAQSAPNFDGTYTVVGPNLTGPGDLVIGPYPGTVSIAGASTVNGDITIVGDAIVITDEVKASGVGRTVTVTATTDGIGLRSLGKITTTNGTVSLSAVNGSIVAANSATITTVTSTSLDVVARDTSVLKTTVSSLSGAVSSGSLTLTETDSLTVAGLDVLGNATLGVGGSLQQSGAIKAGTLNVSASGPITLANNANDAGVVSLTATGRAVTYTDVNDLVVSGITAGPITLKVGNKLSQTGPIVGTTLNITSMARGVQLTDAGNAVDSLFVSNGTRVVNYTDKDDLVVAGLTAGAAQLTVGGNLTQTGAIKAASLNLATSAGDISLSRTDNDVDWLTGINPGRSLSFTDRNALAIGGLSAGTMSLSVGGTLTQANPILGRSLSVMATAGDVILTNGGNAVDSLAMSNGNRLCSFTNLIGLDVVGLTLGGGNLAVGGNLTQSGPIIGTSLGITSSEGTVILTNRFNNLNVLSLANGSRLFSYTDSNDVGIYSSGTLSVGTVTAAGLLSVSATNGGGVDVGPQANGLLQAGNTIDLRGVPGSIGVRDGGRILAPTILLPPGKGIQVGGVITDPTSLSDAITTVNSLPAIPGSTYEIFVASSMTLTQQLSVNKPVTLRGASQSVVLSGSAAVTSGLLLNSGASRSTVRDIAFRGFSGDAIRVASATGITITGVRVLNSGNGLSINGGSTGTVVQGSTFDRNLTGIRLASVTNALIGGTGAGQGNVISNSTREGIYATGFCTGTKLVKNTFPGTPKKYNVSTSRGITVVN
jgi:hypothetical protein